MGSSAPPPPPWYPPCLRRSVTSSRTPSPHSVTAFLAALLILENIYSTPPLSARERTGAHHLWFRLVQQVCCHRLRKITTTFGGFYQKKRKQEFSDISMQGGIQRMALLRLFLQSNHCGFNFMSGIFTSMKTQSSRMHFGDASASHSNNI